MSLRAWLGLIAWLCASAASHALAFSDPLSFSDPVQAGGGGGRFFTGSASDGYGCDVCHSGGPSAKLQLVGLPLAGYLPATSYEIRIEWPTALQNMGLALEITDAAGQAAGALRLPPANELPNEERCEPFDAGLMAGVLNELGTRTVLSVPDCGATRVRFLWTSPAEPRGTLRFSGGFVVSNGEADAEGDGVTLFAHQLPPVGEGDEPAAQAQGTCSIAAGSTPRAQHAAALFALVGCALAGRVRARRARARSRTNERPS